MEFAKISPGVVQESLVQLVDKEILLAYLVFPIVDLNIIVLFHYLFHELTFPIVLFGFSDVSQILAIIDFSSREIAGKTMSVHGKALSLS